MRVAYTDWEDVCRLFQDYNVEDIHSSGIQERILHGNTGPYIHFPHLGNSNLGKLPHASSDLPPRSIDKVHLFATTMCVNPAMEKVPMP